MIRAKVEGAGAAHAKKIEEAKPSGPHRKDTWVFDNCSLEENRRALPNGRSEARR